MINTTPHAIKAKNPKTGVEITIEPTFLIRGRFRPGEMKESVEGIDVVTNGSYVHDPITQVELKDGDVLIVSMVTGNCVEEMTMEEFHQTFQGKKVRILGPGTGPENSERDDKGRILASLQFIEYIPASRLRSY